MELLLIVVPFAAALLTLLGWSAWRGPEAAAVWWIGAALALAAAAVVTTAGLRAELELPPGGPFAPLAAWLLYRGSAEFAGAPPGRWPGALALAAVLLWLGLYAHGSWPEAARYTGLLIEVPLCAASAAVIGRRSSTSIQRLLVAGMATLAVGVVAEPWLRDLSGGSATLGSVVWIALVFPTAMLMVCALLERGTLRAAQELRESQQQLAEAQRVAHVGSWSLDIETGGLEWSDEQFRIHGYEPGAIEPWDALRSGILDPRDREALEASAMRTVRSGEAWDTEVAFLRADGVQIRLCEHSVLVDTRDGGRRILGVTLDVTEQRRAEDELERHRAQLEQLVSERTAQLADSVHRLRTSERLASLGTLAAGIAHQINNPVASILASAQLAQLEEGRPDERLAAKKALRDIEREARRCGEITHGVLQFASDRVTEKRLQPLTPVLQRAAQATSGYAASRGATIVIDDACADVEVVMSAIDIEQVVVNLLRNAIEAREHGVSVRIAATEKDERVLVEVEDDGRGIPGTQLERVFDPFFTRGKDAGTGLGLSVAHGIATEHGGSLWIESAADSGTRVVLALPVRAPKSQPRS